MQTYIKPSELKSKLKTLISIQKPAFIWGASGIGKSEIIAKVADELGYNLIDVRVSLLDPVDLRGVPSVENGTTKWNPPVFLPQEGDGKSILFLDELPHGSPSVQNALFQLIRDRKIGEYSLPSDTIILAAGNRVSDRVGANKINGALANRFSHLHLEAESVSDITKADQKGIVQNSQDQALIGGTVGEGTATEFCAFMGMVNTLPDVSEILKNPKGYEISDDPSVLYALTGALARRADANNFADVITYMTRDEMSKEFAVICVSDAVTVSPKLAKTKAYIDFMSEYKDIMS